LQCLSDTVYEWNNLTDSIGPVTFSKVDIVKKAYMEALKRGVKIRIITEVTKDNIEHCKEGMKYVSELRHMDGISGTFVVGDKHYLSNIVAENIGSFQCVHSNIKSFVDQQKHIFENLWRNAIPATEKIKELEKDENEEFSQIVNSPEEIKQLFLNHIQSSREEILILFSDINALLEYVNLRLLNLISDAIEKRKVQVRVLLPVDTPNYLNANIKKELESNLKNNIHLQNKRVIEGVAAKKGKIIIKTLNKNYKTQFLSKTYFILIVDSKISIIRTSKDQDNIIKNKILDQNSAVSNQNDFCNYSNNEGTVLSNSSIFETLWENAKPINISKIHSIGN
jgi:two-component system, OmpR family, sensor histidine kinase VicK